jgi:hypothetical protein
MFDKWQAITYNGRAWVFRGGALLDPGTEKFALDWLSDAEEIVTLLNGRKSDGWKQCCQASNRIADLMCSMYHHGDAQARKVYPTATMAEMIASSLGIEVPEYDVSQVRDLSK